MRMGFALFAPEFADQIVRDKRVTRGLRQLPEQVDSS